MDTSDDLYGLNTMGLRSPSIIESIRTCKHPRQLEYMMNHVAKVIDYQPNARWYKRFKRAVVAKEKELGIRVMWTDEEINARPDSV